MIAKVRIAAVEHWCAEPAGLSQKDGIEVCVGHEVEIIPASMTTRPECDGKWWRLTEQSGKALFAIMGWTWKPGYDMVCEHMLEMD